MVVKYIEARDYAGPDRRGERIGAKNILNWVIGVAAGALTLAFSVGGFYLQSKELMDTVPALSEKIHAHDIQISEVKKDIQYIREGVDKLVRYQEKKK